MPISKPRPTPGGHNNTWGTVLDEYLAEVETAVERVDPGGTLGAGEIISSSDGISVGKFKPGRIDARVRGVSTAASNNATTLQTLLNESGTEGSELWLGDGEYRTGTVNVPAHAHVNGTGTLKPVATSPSGALLFFGGTGDGEGATVEGITLEGEGASKLLDLSAYPNSLVDATVRNVTFRNTSATFNLDTGVGLGASDGCTIEGCLFDGVAAPIRGSNASNLRIIGNTFRSVTTRNAMDIQISGATVVRGLVIAGNRMYDLFRMGIELVIQGGATGYYDAPVIRDNIAYTASTHSGAGTALGVSVNEAPGATITGNRVYFLAGSTIPTYAYELVQSPGVVLHGNYAYGQLYGISVNSSPHSRIISNTIERTTYGMETPGSYSHSRYLTVRDNNFRNQKSRGIHLHDDGAGSVVEGNTILRDIALGTDGSETFYAIRLESQAVPTRIAANRIIQGQAVPTAGFAFFGIYGLAGSLGLLDETEIVANRFIDLKTGSVLMDPLANSGGGAAVADVVLARNTLTDATGAHTAVSAW